MEIEEKVRLVDVTAPMIWEMLMNANNGDYVESLETPEGKDALIEAYNEAISSLANKAFHMGREYEIKKQK